MGNWNAIERQFKELIKLIYSALDQQISITFSGSKPEQKISLEFISSLKEELFWKYLI